MKVFIEISLTNEKDIKIILETKAKEFVNKNKILVFEYPKIEQKIITKEACEKKEPFFNQDKQEYKDKIIWETLKENAKNDGKNYLFLTNNKSDFNIELLRKEFEKFSPKKLEIFQDIKSLKLYLEKEFNLGTHLKEIYSQKEKEIRANTNKILYSLTGERKDFILYDKNLILANALIEELRIENISENFLYANIKLRGKAKFIEKPRDKEEESIFPFANRSYSEIYTPRYTHFFKKDYEEKDVEIKFVLNLRDYSLENISILEGSYLSPFSAGGIEWKLTGKQKNSEK